MEVVDHRRVVALDALILVLEDLRGGAREPGEEQQQIVLPKADAEGLRPLEAARAPAATIGIMKDRQAALTQGSHEEPCTRDCHEGRRLRAGNCLSNNCPSKDLVSYPTYVVGKMPE